ncbi:type II/IV secretion system protein [Candidatus Uhrbacteria bacterium]|nr:type II/IV secretion system protein [Candidatus Uhrbacteria bacterium]
MSPLPSHQDQTPPEEQLAAKMVELELAAKEREAADRASSLGLPYTNLKGFIIAPEALALITEERANAVGAVSFFYSGAEAHLGAVDPLRPEVKELLYQIEERTKAKGRLYLISEESFHQAKKLFASLPKIKPIVKGIEISEAELARYEPEIKNFSDLQKKITTVPTSDILVLAVAAALTSRASDIHLEAEEQDVKIRFRVDGALLEAAKLDRESWPRVISRIKLISGLKINVTSRPQDGRFTIFYQKEKIDVRVSTIPTAYGESAVMRILRQAAVALDFENLGVRGKALEALAREMSRPNGLIMNTGPTGSGKTTTLYAILKKLNQPEVKIITLEDPVEYKLEGVNQSQIDPSKDYTFAKGLRSLLRQDPDVVMVGEIRDLETAEIAIQAALTGHLVLSTIHTNNAAGAIPRFLSMGVKPFLLAPALNAVIGQRLVRRIHTDCKTEDLPSPELMERVKKILSDLPADSGYTVDLQNLKFWKGAGCDGCNGLGLRGRIGIYEIFTMGAEIEKLILAGSLSQYEVEAAAKRAGMITMVQDGLLKALDGITTVDEVFRVAEE